jgi:ABC-type nitrate/sulfonate/bicarbonate transport system permease component
VKAENGTKNSKLRQYILGFLVEGIILVILGILVIPFWLFIRKFFPSVEYLHALLVVALFPLVLNWHEWGNDERRRDSIYLKMSILSFVYFVAILIFYLVSRAIN